MNKEDKEVLAFGVFVIGVFCLILGVWSHPEWFLYQKLSITGLVFVLPYCVLFLLKQFSKGERL